MKFVFHSLGIVEKGRGMTNGGDLFPDGTTTITTKIQIQKHKWCIVSLEKETLWIIDDERKRRDEREIFRPRFMLKISLEYVHGTSIESEQILS